MRPSLFAAAVLALLATPAFADVTQTRVANLDGDPDLEQVIPQEVPAPYPQRQIVISDTCNGAPYTRVVSSQQDAVVVLTVSNFETITPRPEIFFDLRSGAAGRVGEIGIVSWEDRPMPGSCPEPRFLFRYPSKRTRGRLPKGAVAVSTFDVKLLNLEKRYAGKEVRLFEYYVDRNDPYCCASFRRVTDFGYNAGKDLYVKFRTRVKRIRK